MTTQAKTEADQGQEELPQQNGETNGYHGHKDQMMRDAEADEYGAEQDIEAAMMEIEA